MKKLINRPEAAVEEMIGGLVAVYPGLDRLAGEPVVVRTDATETREGQVAVISGGGSGHEPAHAGYVGRGMLSAAVLGDVFTSHAPDAVLAAIRAVAGRPGALLVVKNYTGDRLNFGLAAELARGEGWDVEVVVVADDVALPDDAAHASLMLASSSTFWMRSAAAARSRTSWVRWRVRSRSARTGGGGMKLASSRPNWRNWAIHSPSLTSVFRPGTFLS